MYLVVYAEGVDGPRLAPDVPQLQRHVVARDDVHAVAGKLGIAYRGYYLGEKRLFRRILRDFKHCRGREGGDVSSDEDDAAGGGSAGGGARDEAAMAAASRPWGAWVT